MNIKFGFSIYGFVIFIIPMIINLIYAIWPPEKPHNCKKQPIWDEIENVSRILYTVAMCLIVPLQSIDYNSIFFYGMILFIVLYYIVWIRYFIGGRDTKLLGSSFLFIPMPLVIFPVLYFICSALWLGNYIAVIIMIVFGIAHNIVSYRNLYVKNEG